jgi:hypothetical protein
MIAKVIDDLKITAMNTSLVNMVAFGDISLFNEKKTIKYPYVNIDIVESNITGGVKQHKFRIYVCDRNDIVTAYNKTELILDQILKSENYYTENYLVNYFTENFKDVTTGVYVDVNVEEDIITECDLSEAEEIGFILQENGDLIRIES